MRVARVALGVVGAVRNRALEADTEVALAEADSPVEGRNRVAAVDRNLVGLEVVDRNLEAAVDHNLADPEAVGRNLADPADNLQCSPLHPVSCSRPKPVQWRLRSMLSVESNASYSSSS